MTLFNIDQKILSDESKAEYLYSNIFIYNPLLLTTITAYLIKENIYLEDFLKLIHFFIVINKNNISILLRHNILFHLLEISFTENKYNSLLYKIFSFCFPLMQKSDLRIVFEYLIKAFNINKLNFTKDVIKCLINTMQKISYNNKKFSLRINLSGYYLKQPNVYNLINLTNISFNNNTNESVFYVKEEIIFFFFF